MIVVGDLLVGSGRDEGLLSEACGGRRTVLAVVSLVVLAPMLSVRCVLGTGLAVCITC